MNWSVPEGSNMFDIAASLARFNFLKPADFLRAARSPSLIRDLAPDAPTLEGYLFPSTYRITRATTVQQLCVMMTGVFRKHWRELQSSAPPGVPVNDVVTMASLVEKETAVPEERRIVASVYEQSPAQWNHLGLRSHHHLRSAARGSVSRRHSSIGLEQRQPL